jgi:hypothetical protein
MLNSLPLEKTVHDVVSYRSSTSDGILSDAVASQNTDLTIDEVPDIDHIDRRLVAFRRVAAPLLAAVTSMPQSANAEPKLLADQAREFSQLIETTIEINQTILSGLQPQIISGDVSRWTGAGATAEFVAAYYRATGRAIDPGEAAPMIEALQNALPAIAAAADQADDEEADISARPPLARSLKALAPVASSIARFSFGRNAYELLAEVTHRLTTIAVEIAARLSGQEGPELLSSPLYYAVLEVTGEFYLESHFSEMDRLLEMEPEERKAYVRNHDKKIPMEPVWESLEIRLGMLEALATYLPLPAISHGDDAS